MQARTCLACAGFPHVHVANYEPFLPYGARGVFAGASIVFFSFIGFDAVSNTHGLIAQPQATHLLNTAQATRPADHDAQPQAWAIYLCAAQECSVSITALSHSGALSMTLSGCA